MALFCALLCAANVAIGAGAAAAGPAPRWHQLNAEYGYDQYRGDFGKPALPQSSPERTMREPIFLQNLAGILAHNAADPPQSWKQGVNQFTDMTDAEFKSHLGSPAAMAAARAATRGTSAPAPAAAAMPSTLPKEVDWRGRGVLSAVKDQGGCGSCWAFASTEMIETYAAMSTTPYSLTDLAPQQLVACSPNPNHCGGIGGCDGSTAELAFEYIKGAGMTTEWFMPYTAHSGGCGGAPGQPGCPCTYNASTMKTVTLDGFVKLPANDLAATMAAVAVVGPMAVNVQANTWSRYESGVFPSSECGGGKDGVAIDHVVQLVGYTEAAWIIRNSWTPQWGDQGFIMLEKARSNTTEPCALDNTPGDGVGCAVGPSKMGNSSMVCGTCGMLFDVSYPTGVKYATKPKAKG